MSIVQTIGIPNSQIVDLKNFYNITKDEFFAQYPDSCWCLPVDYAEYPSWEEEKLVIRDEFVFKGDGRLICDSYVPSGADYAKFFE